jgi:hypothetical protein
MDWSKVLNFAKKEGYTGSDTDAAAVQGYLASKSITLADADGNDLDLVALAAKLSSLSLSLRSNPTQSRSKHSHKKTKPCASRHVRRLLRRSMPELSPPQSLRRKE